jgi:hypothetical protein
MSTNPCESMIETVGGSRNVKRWLNGDMCLRRTAVACSKSSANVRRFIGHGELPKVARRRRARRQYRIEHDVADQAPGR